jgi:hypothetical protein
MQAMAVTIQSFVKQGLPCFPVALFEKDVRSVVAAQDDMVEAARDE